MGSTFRVCIPLKSHYKYLMRRTMLEAKLRSNPSAMQTHSEKIYGHSSKRTGTHLNGTAHAIHVCNQVMGERKVTLTRDGLMMMRQVVLWSAHRERSPLQYWMIKTVEGSINAQI
ncbi:mRNA capping enzyme family protein [Striga asiatica]|uniref:mRNA capping enzyme family protein n=1 Tax=Striga asiatica TaxID=4170 RepID=A0A5A7PFH3_STRAF|nr:mRNA capping enzyme family protein [Striga asiatica]